MPGSTSSNVDVVQFIFVASAFAVIIKKPLPAGQW